MIIATFLSGLVLRGGPRRASPKGEGPLKTLFLPALLQTR
jgi:hypothetical protein